MVFLGTKGGWFALLALRVFGKDYGEWIYGMIGDVGLRMDEVGFELCRNTVNAAFNAHFSYKMST